MNAATTRFRLLLVLGALAVNPAHSVGQERPDSVVRLEPLTVRVLRTSVGQGLPFPVSVASGDELTRARGGAYLEEALQALPGVQVQNRFNLAAGERLAIRGFGARAQFGIRGVRVLVDGIPATLADGQTALDHLDPSAIGRVEMLRGPGGALYGNAAGGVLHFQTRPPSEGLEVGVESAGGSFGLTTLRASVSDGRGDTGYRASVSRYTFDGYRPNPVADDGSVFGDQSRTVVNAVLQTPLARGTLTLSANAMDMAGDNPGSLSTALQETDRLQAFRFNVIQRTREDIRQGQIGVSWAGALGSLEGEAAAWGIRRDFEGAIPPAIVGFDRNAGGVRALVRGSRGTRAATLTVSGGVEAEFQSDDRQNWANDGGERGPLDLDQDESVRGTAVFGQARLDLHARVGLLAAVRYDRFRFAADDRFLSDGADDSGERILDAVSPSFGVVVEAGDGVELFGSWASSFETPTTTELTNRPEGAGGFNPSLEPTRGRTLEAGVRARIDRRLALEGTLFRTDLEDELVAFEVPATPGRTFFRNAGESRHTGWEMALDGRPAPAWALRAAYTRVNGRYETYAVDGEDFSGNRIPGLAPYRIDGRIAWEPRGGFVELRGLYQDALPVDDANTASSPGYFLADVRAGLEGYRAGRVALAPWVAVANALDRTYNTAVVVNAFGGRFYEPGPGRTFRLGMAVTWGSR
ncbi:MAG: TonB-dependent receptor [Longimicrobiales bacterium]